MDFKKTREIYGQVFDGTLPNIVASKFQYFNPVRGQDNKGAEFKLTATAATSRVSGAEVLRLGQSKPFMAKGGEVDSVFSKIKSDGGALNLVWDKAGFSAILNKASVGGLAAQQPVSVSARDLLYRQFPEVAAGLGQATSSALGEAIETASATKTNPGGIGHLVQARDLMFPGVSKLSDTQVYQTVLLGGAMRAVDKGEKRVFGLDFFKSFLAKSGFQGLSVRDSSLLDATDPHNLADAISESAARVLHVDSNIHRNIRHTAGPKYLEAISAHIEGLSPDVRAAMSLRMDSSGGLYAGVGSDLSSYRALPIGYMDDVGKLGASDRGAVSGVIRTGGRRSYARPIYDPETRRLHSYAEKALGSFFGGMTGGPAGATMDNLAMSIHVGSETLRKNKALVSETMLSLGQQSILPALYAQGTASVPHNVLKNVDQALTEMLTGVANHKMPLGAYNKSIKESIDRIASEYSGLNFSAGAWTAVKHHIDRGNVLPTKGLESFFLPGVLSDERVLSKGTYHVTRTREIAGGNRISKIMSSNAALGGRIMSVGSTVGGIGLDLNLNKAYARQGGAYSSALTSVMYLPSKNKSSVAQGRRMFGDSMFYMTNLGKQGIGYDSSSMKKVKDFMTRDQLVDYLNQVRGSGAGWDEYIDSIHSGKVREGFHQPSQPLKLGNVNRGKLGKLAPARGTTHLFGINLNEYSSERNIAFGRQGPRSHASFVLGSNMRMTAATGKANMYGEAAEDAVHFVSGMESLSAQNSFHRQYHHKLGLLSTQESPASIGQFVDAYKAKGGKGLSMVGEGAHQTIVAGAGLDADSFNKYADEALSELGFSKGSLQGEAGAVLRLMGKDKAAQNAARGAKVFLQDIRERSGAAEDIAGLKHGLRARLATHRLVGAASGGQDPVWKVMSAGMESQVSNRIGGKFRLNKSDFSSSRFVQQVPDGIKKPFMPVFSRGFAPKANEVMSLSEFGKKFGSEINSFSLEGKGMSFNALKSTALYDESRAGSFIDLGTGVEVRVSGHTSSDKYKASKSRFMWLPSGKEFSRSLKGAGDDPVRFGEGSLQKTFLEMISAQGSGDPQAVKLLAKEAIERQIHTGGKAKSGLEGSKLFFEAPVSAKGRLLSTFSSADDAVSSVVTGGKVNKDAFDVFVNEDMLKEMFTDKGSRYMSKAEHGSALKRLKGGGSIFGTFQPTPQHGGGHIPLVNIRLDTDLKSGAGPAIRLGDFLAQSLERDFDKDVGALMAFSGKETMGYAKEGLGVGSDREVNAVFASHMKSQRTKMAFQAQRYEQAEEMWDKVFGKSLTTGSKQFHEAITKFHAFGNTPSVAWTPYWSQFEFSAAIAGKASPGDVASGLNNLATNLSTKITGSDVEMFRRNMGARGMTASQTFREASYMQHNVAQAAIAKGGKFLASMEAWHGELGAIGDSVRSGNMSMQSAIEAAQKASTAFGLELSHGGKLKGYSEMFSGKSAIEAGKIFGDVVGVFTGAHIYAKGKFMEEGGSFFSSIQKGLSSNDFTYDALGTARALNVNDVIGNSELVSRVQVNAQEELANTNNAAKAGGNALEQGSDFLKKNWKGIGIAGGGLIAARALYGALSSGPEAPRLPINNMGQAPLPAEPMVSRQQSGPPIPMPSHSVRANNMNGMTSSRSNTSRMSSVNIQGPSSSFNMGAIGSNWSRTTVRDERSFTSGWEHQRLSEAGNNSDFVHKYMDL